MSDIAPPHSTIAGTVVERFVLSGGVGGQSSFYGGAGHGDISLIADPTVPPPIIFGYCRERIILAGGISKGAAIASAANTRLVGTVTITPRASTISGTQATHPILSGGISIGSAISGSGNPRIDTLDYGTVADDAGFDSIVSGEDLQIAWEKGNAKLLVDITTGDWEIDITHVELDVYVDGHLTQSFTDKIVGNGTTALEAALLTL